MRLIPVARGRSSENQTALLVTSANAGVQGLDPPISLGAYAARRFLHKPINEASGSMVPPGVRQAVEALIKYGGVCGLSGSLALAYPMI